MKKDSTTTNYSYINFFIIIILSLVFQKLLILYIPTLESLRVDTERITLGVVIAHKPKRDKEFFSLILLA